MQNFNSFLYTIHNSVFQNMRLSSMEEYNNLNFNSFQFNNTLRLDQSISEVLKQSISNDIIYELTKNIAEINNFLENKPDYPSSNTILLNAYKILTHKVQ